MPDMAAFTTLVQSPEHPLCANVVFAMALQPIVAIRPLPAHSVGLDWSA